LMAGERHRLLKVKRTKFEKVTKRIWGSGSVTPWQEELWQ